MFFIRTWGYGVGIFLVIPCLFSTDDFSSDIAVEHFGDFSLVSDSMPYGKRHLPPGPWRTSLLKPLDPLRPVISEIRSQRGSGGEAEAFALVQLDDDDEGSEPFEVSLGAVVSVHSSYLRPPSETLVSIEQRTVLIVQVSQPHVVAPSGVTEFKGDYELEFSGCKGFAGLEDLVTDYACWHYNTKGFWPFQQLSNTVYASWLCKTEGDSIERDDPCIAYDVNHPWQQGVYADYVWEALTRQRRFISTVVDGINEQFQVCHEEELAGAVVLGLVGLLDAKEAAGEGTLQQPLQ